MPQQQGLKDKDRREAFDYATGPWVIISFHWSDAKLRHLSFKFSMWTSGTAAADFGFLFRVSLFREDLKYLQASDICISENPSFT